MKNRKKVRSIFFMVLFSFVGMYASNPFVVKQVCCEEKTTDKVCVFLLEEGVAPYAVHARHGLNQPYEIVGDTLLVIVPQGKSDWLVFEDSASNAVFMRLKDCTD